MSSLNCLSKRFTQSGLISPSKMSRMSRLLSRGWLDNAERAWVEQLTAFASHLEREP